MTPLNNNLIQSKVVYCFTADKYNISLINDTEALRLALHGQLITNMKEFDQDNLINNVSNELLPVNVQPQSISDVDGRKAELPLSLNSMVLGAQKKIIVGV